MLLSECRQKAILPRRRRIALSANERIAEFLDFAIQAKFAYVNKLSPALKSRAQTVDKKGTFGFRKYPFTIISSFSSRQRSPFLSFHVASFFKFMDANKRVS